MSRRTGWARESSDDVLVHRLAYNGDVAAGQLAVFQGASEAPISGFIRVERATRKNSQLAAARRVALKMGRLGETYRRIGVAACRRLQSIINSVETSWSL